jgi:hypothetical protein
LPIKAERTEYLALIGRENRDVDQSGSSPTFEPVSTEMQ